MTSKKRIMLPLAVLCLIVLTASPVLAAEKSIVIGISGDSLFFDPQQNQETITTSVCRHVYEPLVSRDPGGGAMEPCLAESWELDDDQVTWTFHLRKNVTFSNGAPFTAEDVVYTIERARNYSTRNMVANMDRIEVLDPHTIKIITKTPSAVLLDYLVGLLIMNKEYTESISFEEVNLKPMGTGPYVLLEWVKEDHMSFTANKNYWGEAPAITHVRMRPITNAATRTAALLTGEVDIAEDIPVRDIARVEKTAGIDVVTRPSKFLMYLHIDANREPTPAIEGAVNPMKDPRVREAVSLGIDRAIIAKVTMNGNAYPTGQLILEGQRGYLPGLPLPEYNVEKARALLKEAGYENGFTVILDGPNGRYPNDGQIAQALASQLAKIGITIELRLHPKSVFFDFVRPGDKSSLVLTGWSEYTDTGTMGNILFYTRDKTEGKGASNRCHYSNAEYDRLLDAADATADVEKRRELLEESSRVILGDYGVIPILFNQDVYGKKAKVHFVPRSDKEIHTFLFDIEE